MRERALSRVLAEETIVMAADEGESDYRTPASAGMTL